MATVKENITNALTWFYERLKSNDLDPLQDQIDELNTNLEYPIELTSQFTLYGDEKKVSCYKTGNFVFLQGIITPTSSISGGTSRHEITTLPDACKPMAEVNIVCQGSNQYRWCLGIDPDGVVSFARYTCTSSFATCEPNTWLPFALMFLATD